MSVYSQPYNILGTVFKTQNKHIIDLDGCLHHGAIQKKHQHKTHPIYPLQHTAI